jgi:hypothetical protein
MDKNKTKNVNIFSRWFGGYPTFIMLAIIATILLCISGFFLYRKLAHTKMDLESCRSSCSS